MSEAHSILSLADEQFGWYFSGLVDGEGYFSLSHQRDTRPGRTSGWWRLIFGITLRSDDSPGLIAIATRFRIGFIQHSPPRREKENPCIRWTVARINHLAEIIVPHFERFPLQLKKARDFTIWKEAVLVMHGKSKRSTRGTRCGGGCPSLTSQEHVFMETASARLRDVRKFDSGQTLATVKEKAKAIKPAPVKTLFDNL